jgi:hypothetical protein
MLVPFRARLSGNRPVAVILGLGLGPDLLHRLDPLAHQFEAGFVDRAMVLHLVLVPAAADTKQRAAVRHLIDQRAKLGRLDRVALLHQGQK